MRPNSCLAGEEPEPGARCKTPSQSLMQQGHLSAPRCCRDRAGRLSGKKGAVFSAHPLEAKPLQNWNQQRARNTDDPQLSGRQFSRWPRLASRQLSRCLMFSHLQIWWLMTPADQQHFVNRVYAAGKSKYHAGPGLTRKLLASVSFKLIFIFVQPGQHRCFFPCSCDLRILSQSQ